jgi:hypothetical protein
MQQQTKQLAVLLLHQHAISSGPTFTWEFSMPVSKWLPGATEEVVAGPCKLANSHGLWLQIANVPYSATAYGIDCLAGFAVRLAAGKTPEMASLSELKLRIPFTAMACSTLTLEAMQDSRGCTTHEQRTSQLDADISGSMCGGAGALIVFERSVLQRLNLVHYNGYYKDHDARHLEQQKNRTLKFSLEFKLSG